MAQSIIERAYELAAFSHCRTLEDIERALREEMFESVNAHMRSLSLRKELLAVIEKNGSKG